jgi:hypothetical protein
MLLVRGRRCKGRIWSSIVHPEGQSVEHVLRPIPSLGGVKGELEPDVFTVGELAQRNGHR